MFLLDLNFVGGPFTVDKGLVFRVHVSMIGVRQNVSILKLRGHRLCILLGEHIHDSWCTNIKEHKLEIRYIYSLTMGDCFKHIFIPIST